MSIKKKILAMIVGPILTLGIISVIFTLTRVKSAMVNEIQDALKGTAAATLAAYDQNTGDYIQASNGDIWKGSYNVSKSESLVDGIKQNTGMDVTFFYGSQRVMTQQLIKMATGFLVHQQVILLLIRFLITDRIILVRMYRWMVLLTMDILCPYIRMEVTAVSLEWCLLELIGHRRMR